MKKLNLTVLSISELQALKAELDQEFAVRDSKMKVLDEVKLMVQANGLKFEDVLLDLGFSKAGVRVKRELGPAPVRFRHPKNPNFTWSGRGKRPNWMRDALASGFTEDQLRV